MDTIGTLLEGLQERDAIHIAIAPVIAGHNLLYPGNRIGFIKDDNRTVGATASKKIGIVDPFLIEPLKTGEQFWMFLFPNTITSLKHNWTHPDFSLNADKKESSKQWITNWAAGYGMDYDYAMKCGDNEDFFLGEVYNDQIPSEFWIHYEILTGRKVSENTRNRTYFHCAC